MPDLGQAYVQIVPSAEGIKGSITNVLKGEGESAGESTGKLLGGSCVSSAKLAIAGGAAALAGAVALAVKGAADIAAQGDEIDKESQKLGISAKAYQEWNDILGHSGTSMSSMSSAMKKLVKNVQNGTGDFAKIGLSMEDVQNMSQEDLFSATITGLQNMTDESERNKAASELLGRGYTELLPLLNTTAEDTEAMRQTFNDLGGVMSDDAVKDSAAFNDALQDMNTAFGGIKRSVLQGLMPVLTKCMTWLTTQLADEEGLGGFLKVSGELAGKLWKALVPALKLTGKALKTFIHWISKAFEWAGKMIDKVGEIKDKFADFKDKLGEFVSFKWLKVPSITVSGGKAPWGIGGMGTKPSFDVKWNAEGGIFNSASIIGYGVGEAGQEAIVPLDKFWKELDKMQGGYTFNVVVNAYGMDAKNVADEVERTITDKYRRVANAW